MNKNTRIIMCIAAALLAVTGLAGAVAAPVHADTLPHDDGVVGNDDEEEEQDEDDGGDTIVNIDLDEVVDAVEDLEDEISDLVDGFSEFVDSWDETVKEILIAVLFEPFKFLAQQLLRYVVILLTTTPDVHPNPAVEEIHRLTLAVTYVLASLGFIAAGLLYMIGPVFGVSYRDARLLIPRLVAALMFASVSPILLQYAVDFTNLLVDVFKPDGLTASIGEMAGLGVSLLLVWVIEAFVLLAVVLIFVLRNVYILFTVAISPLIALAWAIPPTKRYADAFIGGFWTALAMAPLDVLVLRFNLALMNGAGTPALQTISNWVFGVAGFTLLILVPYQLYGASQAVVGQAYRIAGGAKQRIRKHRNTQRFDDLERRRMRERMRQAQRQRRRGRRGRVYDD